MVFARLIERKRDGGALSEAEWCAVIEGLMSGTVPDYQMSALLMAVLFRGLAPDELRTLTGLMRDSGARLDFADWSVPRVDKHSTGGVGDKVSLVLAPLAASLGLAVPMMSGRALGHTGGTTDKLESIAGFRTDLTLTEVRSQVERIGLALFGQSPEVAPADGRLYALRDVTGTVPSIPLIAASIMSKKLAEGLHGLVLDVKTGSGAFLTEVEAALELARTMVELGSGAGCPTVALLTAMDRPLGRAIGNSLEVEEAIATLDGQGPSDLRALTRALVVEMLLLADRAPDAEAAGRLVDQALAGGAAKEKLRQVIEAQGGSPGIVDDPAGLPQAASVELFEAPRDAVVTAVHPRPLGEAVVAMGGGRQRVGEPIDHSVGFIVSARPGQKVVAGEPLASVFARDQAGVSLGLDALSQAIRFGTKPEPVLPLISHRVTVRGIEPYVA